MKRVMYCRAESGPLKLFRESLAVVVTNEEGEEEGVRRKGKGGS